MQHTNGISMSVIRRLPRYYRYIEHLENAGIERISSKDLANMMCLTASQVRQDFNCFGGFGQQGYGYYIKELKKEIEQILCLDSEKNAILLGAGHLGHAVASYITRTITIYKLLAVFDVNYNMIGDMINESTPILDVNKLCSFLSENKVDMAVLCVPHEPAKTLVKVLYENGIKNFWNFTSYHIVKDYPDAIVESVHLSDSLMTLKYLSENN